MNLRDTTRWVIHGDLQCVVMCCSVLKCVAVCCSVSHVRVTSHSSIAGRAALNILSGATHYRMMTYIYLYVYVCIHTYIHIYIHI